MDTRMENYTECYKLYKQLVSSTNMTNRKFAREYGKLFDEKTNTNKFYLLILNELTETVSKGDIDSLKRLDNSIRKVNDLESKVTLKGYYDSEENPIKNSNLVILACKYNKLDILKYIFASGMKNRLTCDIGRNEIAYNDQDEDCHNAFYYSVRSNKVELLDTLINEWPGDYFITHSEQLDEVLSDAYEELKLKNVPLSEELQIYIESKLIDLRFFSDASKKLNNENNIRDTKNRIELVLENISLLRTEYLDAKEADEQFLFVMKFIIQNVHILKQQLKSTYDKIPWEEMVFCLVSFVSSQAKRQELNLFYRAILNKRKMLNYLGTFAGMLDKEKENRISTYLPTEERHVIISNIIKDHPQLEGLYADYQQIRDICTLQKMSDYVELALSIDPKERQGQLIIMRILQVIGEHLKNSLESPKLSDFTSEILLLSFPKNTRKVFRNLRDSLSHTFSLAMRTKLEKNMDVKFFIGVHNDIKKIGDSINNVLYKEKMKVISMLSEKLINSENLNEIKEVAEVFLTAGNELIMIEEELQTMETEELGILIEELNDSIIEKTEREQKVLDKIRHIISVSAYKSYNMTNKYFSMFATLKEFTQWFKMTDNNVKTIKSHVKELKGLPTATQSCDLNEIAELLTSIYYEMRFRMGADDFDNVHSIIYKICSIVKFEMSSVQWIEGLRTKLTEKSTSIVMHKQKDNQNMKEMCNNELKLKLSELKNILADNELISNLNEKLSSYRKNKKLQSVIEMLVLDVMSILHGLKRLENNSFFLDDTFPLLTGRLLRNHLAHDNTIINILLSDPSLNIILNAKKLVSENVTGNERRLGKLRKSDYLKVTGKYKQRRITVINQQAMFAALEEGRFEDIESCLRKGADLRARDTNLWTALHFAAKGSNLEIVKFLLNQKLDANVKNIDGQSPLHVASANGRSSIVKHLVEEQFIDVNDTDNCEKTPLHVAAQNGHMNTVDVLLKNGSELDMYDVYSYTPLYHAVQNNCIDIVKILIEQSADFDVNKRAVGDLTVLHVAAKFGYLESINLLFEYGANVSVNNEYDETPLHLAALHGHLEVVEALIAKGASVNARSIRGCTPLHYTIKHGHESVAKVLLKHGADANARDKMYSTPLHYAAMNGYKEIILDLLKRKANTNVATTAGITPLHWSARHGHMDVVSILINQGVDVHATDENNATALYHAASEGHREIVEILLRNKADLNVRTSSGVTPLHTAIQNNQKEVADFLILNKTEVNAAGNDGNTPLHIATISPRNKDIIELLTRNKAEVDIKNNYGWTPLHVAARYGCTDNAIVLLRNKANVNAKAIDNVTPLHLAIFTGQREIVEILLANGATVNGKNKDPTPFVAAIKFNEKEIVESLVANGVNILSEGSEALATAAANGHREIVEVLLRNGVPVNERHNNNTFLQLAAERGHNETVKALISRGAMVNAVDEFDRTALHYAAQGGNEEVVETLTINGANVNVRCKNGRTPLHLSAANGHFNVVQILLDHGARIDIQDGKCATALEVAVRHSSLKVVQALLLASEVDINTKYDGWTLLHIAALQPDLGMIIYLVDEGADINAKSELNLKPVHVAAAQGHKDIVEYFLRKGMSFDEFGTMNGTLLHHAVAARQLEVVKYLIQQGANVNARTDLGSTPLHFAAAKNYTDIMEVLLENSAMYNAVDISNTLPRDMANNERARGLLTITEKLFEAVKRNDSYNVEKYMKAGAFVNAKDSEDNTPIHYAAWKGYDGIVGILLENAANPNAVSKGYTPLHYAAKFSHLKVSTLLLSKAARYDAVSSTGEIPLNLATDKKLIHLFRLISKSFRKVESNDAGVIDDLSRINEKDLIRVVMNARNENNESLMVVAIRKNFRNVERLKEVVQDGIPDHTRGLILLDQGNFNMALNFLKNALEKRRMILGPDDPSTLEIQSHIARALYEKGLYQEALEMFKEILPKQNEILGSSNNDTLYTKSIMALVLHRLTRDNEAYNVYQELYQKQKEILGLNHPHTIVNRFHMALVLNSLGRYEEALDINKAVYEQWKSTLGINHPETLHAQNNIALALAGQGKLKDALKMYEDVLSRKRLTLGDKHPGTLRTLALIANTVHQQNKHQESLERYQELINIQETILGPDHPETLNTHYNISMVLFEQRKWISAYKVCRKIILRMKNVLPAAHPTLLETLKVMEHCKPLMEHTGVDISDIFHRAQEVNNAAKNGDARTVQRLLEDGFDLNDTDIEGRTPLHYAASRGQMNVVKLLLKHGADVDVFSVKGNTPLHVATFNGHKKIVDVLLKHVNRDKLNNFVNAKTIATGTTPLHIAVKKGFLDIVYCLLAYGAIYNIKDKEGKTPSDLSRHQGIVGLLNMIDKLFAYVENGNNEIIRKLKLIKELKSEEFVAVKNARNSGGHTLLQVAIFSLRKDVACELLKILNE